MPDLEKMFSGKEPTTIHEVLKRKAEFHDQFQDWMREADTQIFLKNLKENLLDPGKKGESSVQTEIYRSKYANGFAIFNQAYENYEFFSFLHEYLKDMTLASGYRLANADRRITDRGNHVETVEMYYLKPPVSSGMPISQIFGNVQMLLLLEGRTPQYLKVMANVYSDRNYREALSFDLFLKVLFP